MWKSLSDGFPSRQLQIGGREIQLCPGLFTAAPLTRLTVSGRFGSVHGPALMERCGATAALTEQKSHKKPQVGNAPR